MYIYIYTCIYKKFNKYIREKVTKTYEHFIAKSVKNRNHKSKL